MTNPFDFSGKNVFVAGGSSGINLGIAEAFARHGAQVAICSRSKERVDAAVAKLGAGAIGFPADVRDYARVAEVLAATRAVLGELDVVVSGAAGNFPAPAAGLSSNGFRAVLEIDCLGTFNVLSAAYEHLRKPGATIVNISAPQALFPIPLQAHVCAAKAGVDMVTRVLAIEWGVEGVRVNSIAPGPIEDTEGMRRLAPTPDSLQAVAAALPLKRCGQIEEVAQVALFLASPLAGYITGVILPVDGGLALLGSSAIGETFRATFYAGLAKPTGR